MRVEQIYEISNDVAKEVLGIENLVREDLSNVVDLGNAVFDADAVDKYVKTLINRIGRVVFVDRPYTGRAPKVLMDSWEFGSILEKIQMELPEATENESWELEDGQVYEENIFYKPTISAKFYNDRVTFEIPISITEKQVKQSFTSASELNSFISMIYTAIDKAMTIRLDGLVMRTINNFIGEVIADEFASGGYGDASGVRAINLLYEYNEEANTTGTDLIAKDALKDADFLRFASMKVGLVEERLKDISTLYNVGGKERFTPEDRLHVVLLDEFLKATDVYLQSDTFHNEFTKLPNGETVTHWQGTGTDYKFASTSKINVKTSGNHEVTISGVLGVMFDREALGVSNLDRRTTSKYNAKAEFTNNWFKMDAGYFNDLDENFVVFFIEDPTA